MNNYKVEAEVKRIDAKMATWILENCHFEFQRDTNTSSSKNWINFLAVQMTKGRFHPTSPLIFALSDDNKFNYLINGYHTLKAVIKSNSSFDMVISTFSIKDKKEASILYTHIDIGKNRTGAQRLSAMEAAKELGIKSSYVGKSISAIKYIISGFPNNRLMPILATEDELDLLREWKAEIFFFFDIHKEVTMTTVMRERVLISSVLAPSLVVLRYDFDNATNFLRSMMDGAGLNPDSPILKFRDRLIETRRIKGLIGTGATKGYLSRAFARSWNTYVDNGDMSRLVVRDSEIEKNIVLKNTPLDGSRDTFQFMKEYLE